MKMLARGLPPLTVQEVGYWWYGNIFEYDEIYRERLQAGLRKAGVPEGAGTDINYADFKRLIRDSAGEYDVDGCGEDRCGAGQEPCTHEGAVFVDVRNANGFRRGHIPAAANLEMSTGLSKESCRGSPIKMMRSYSIASANIARRSTYACAKALIWGYTRVHYFAGGFPAWKDAGYPVETSPQRGS